MPCPAADAEDVDDQGTWHVEQWLIDEGGQVIDGATVVVTTDKAVDMDVESTLRRHSGRDSRPVGRPGAGRRADRLDPDREG